MSHAGKKKIHSGVKLKHSQIKTSGKNTSLSNYASEPRQRTQSGICVPKIDIQRWKGGGEEMGWVC